MVGHREVDAIYSLGFGPLVKELRSFPTRRISINPHPLENLPILGFLGRHRDACLWPYSWLPTADDLTRCWEDRCARCRTVYIQIDYRALIVVYSTRLQMSAMGVSGSFDALNSHQHAERFDLLRHCVHGLVSCARDKDPSFRSYARVDYMPYRCALSGPWRIRYVGV